MKRSSSLVALRFVAVRSLAVRPAVLFPTADLVRPRCADVVFRLVAVPPPGFLADARVVFVLEADFLFAAVRPVFVFAADRLLLVFGDAVAVRALFVAALRLDVFFFAAVLAPPRRLVLVVCAIGILPVWLYESLPQLGTARAGRVPGGAARVSTHDVTYAPQPSAPQPGGSRCWSGRAQKMPPVIVRRRGARLERSDPCGARSSSTPPQEHTWRRNARISTTFVTSPPARPTDARNV
jgi:hypothetical protein